MYTNFKNCIGKNIEKVFLEWFYFNAQPDSIIRLYIKVDSYYDIICCEENVFIREQQKMPISTISREFTYKPIEQNIEWLHQCKIVAIKYLVDINNIKRGIMLIFEHNHNFIFYNNGYESGDNDEFEIDTNIDLLPYSVIDI
jgi:hypothetical protein